MILSAPKRAETELAWGRDGGLSDGDDGMLFQRFLRVWLPKLQGRMNLECY